MNATQGNLPWQQSYRQGSQPNLRHHSLYSHVDAVNNGRLMLSVCFYVTTFVAVGLGISTPPVVGWGAVVQIIFSKYFIVSGRYAVCNLKIAIFFYFLNTLILNWQTRPICLEHFAFL